MDQAHSPRATLALQKLAELDPAFASLSLWCKHRNARPVEALSVYGSQDGTLMASRVTYELAPAYTDGSTIYYGREFETFSLDEQVGLCAHELMHVAFRHVSRGKKLRQRLGADYDSYVMNIAADAIINDTLIMAGRKLPKSCVRIAELFKLALGEDILPEQAIATYDAERLYMRLMNESELGRTGETAMERARHYGESKGFHDDMDQRGPLTPEDAEEDNNWRQRLSRALRQGAMTDRGVGRLGHRIADIPRSRTPWELILRRLVTKAVSQTPRPSMDRPTRRWLAQDDEAHRLGKPMPAYETGIVKMSAQPRIVIGVDVSGSVSDKVLERFAGEVAAIANKAGSEIHILVFDTTVRSHSVLRGVDLKREIRGMEFARGGSTSFVDVIDRARDIAPSIIVVLTDLRGAFGEPPGRIPVVWATPDDAPPEVPFGRVIPMDA
jgi:predicted metal-dependent peptidase